MTGRTREHRVYLDLARADIAALAQTLRTAAEEATPRQIGRAVALLESRVAPLFSERPSPRRNAHTLLVVAEHLGVSDDTLVAALSEPGRAEVRRRLAEVRALDPALLMPRYGTHNTGRVRLDLSREDRARFGSYLQQRRETLGLQVGDLAEAVGVPESWVRQLEAQSSETIARKRFRTLATVLGIEAADLCANVPALAPAVVTQLFSDAPARAQRPAHARAQRPADEHAPHAPTAADIAPLVDPGVLELLSPEVRRAVEAAVAQRRAETPLRRSV